jgi:hypothetical protein
VCTGARRIERFRYSDFKEAARVAADAGVMQVQLRKSRFGGVRSRRVRAPHPTGREEELLRAEMWCGKDELGEWGKGIGWTGRHKER